ncbi:secreted protein [Streptomyces albus]|uniref:Secreted protein n=1 Tax=Streptomyces albus (strain ATCC 21838 / DSM 41398 / FERM P-419 / JCM 4703 / NBRC 107858) TaxID=1081613 RepID=A0A0B5F3X2_STRA4|nr:secreted protein [Streptomyces albus]AOU79308.1 secreted protein [Streptomyces albus]AYN35035.1 secreted protein [Streptomyces albus]
MAALTAAAMAAVGFLAYQASANAPEDLGREPAAKSPGASGPESPAKPKPDQLPAHSGTGERVVYSLRADRVWLVGEDNRAQTSYRVTPSSVDPLPGSYRVTSRSESVVGSDGVPIEHVVRFAVTDGVVIGFSAAVDGSTPKPDPDKRTGGIRQSRSDANVMWKFAGEGGKVVVVR